MKRQHQRVPRGEVQGWSEGATRRNTQFLMSIIETRLDGYGVAVTLTLRDCPETAQDWHKIRKAWTERMRRAGMIRLHWVTEWQRRGVPHLHGAIWFPDRESALGVLEAWEAVASKYGASLPAQHARRIDGAVGWFQYMAKHAARGVKHYQRSSTNIPEGWKNKTGRVWGSSGDWPIQEAVKVNLQDQHGDGGWFAFRRLIRSWRKADARADRNAWRIRSARQMLKCSDQGRSRVIGFMEWIPFEVQMAMLANLGERGYQVRFEE